MSDDKRIVINKCFGGFGLSHEAVLRYAEIKGITLYPETSDMPSLIPWTYWTVPKSERLPEISSAEFMELPQEERIARNERSNSETLDDRRIDRDDPALVQVVEELGDRANSRFAELRIVEVPSDAAWEISEYDGNEHVAEKHRTWP